MNVKRLDILVYCVVFTTIGAIGGWVASSQGSQGAAVAEAKDDAESHQASGPVLSKQTLKNLGVTTAKAEVTTFVKFRSIPAAIERTPFNAQPVFAPIGGRILDISVTPGTVAKSGKILVRMVREPIARPTLTLTENIVSPAREEVHQSVSRLRKARAELEIVKAELERVTKFTGNSDGKELPILPRQTIIDLRYSRIRTENTIDQARLELTKHGFTAEQITSIAEGGAIPDLARENWMRALVANGFWPPEAQELFAALPDDLRSQRWTIATVAELSVSGLVQPSFIAWIKRLGDQCKHFLEIAALLQRGYSIEDLERLHGLNALDPIVNVEAPGTDSVADWNVETIDVKPGSRVIAGEQLLTLLNPREMYLRTNPVGAETADVIRSVTDVDQCEALPLVRGSGPKLTGITLEFLRSEPGGHGTIAFATIENSALARRTRPDGRLLRSWALRSGLRYVLRVPTKKIERVFVLPSAAVTDDGPRKVVFIPDGESFKQVEVEIAYQDDEVAVIAVNKDSKLFPGDQVVTGGAYSLGLALKTGPSKVDPHAGHSH
jgi:multidrug efflux pump subunit AcrA (membrane-fusion protein)